MPKPYFPNLLVISSLIWQLSGQVSTAAATISTDAQLITWGSLVGQRIFLVMLSNFRIISSQSLGSCVLTLTQTKLSFGGRSIKWEFSPKNNLHEILHAIDFPPQILSLIFESKIYVLMPSSSPLSKSDSHLRSSNSPLQDDIIRTTSNLNTQYTIT